MRIHNCPKHGKEECNNKDDNQVHLCTKVNWKEPVGDFWKEVLNN